METKLEQRSCDLLRVVLFGPECTGKTTLASQLAKHFHTQWVPEYSRSYLQKKWDLGREVCQPSDLLPIARGQMELENMAAQKADRVLFCDTNLLETVVYSRAYYDGYCDPTLLKHALKARYDFYFLTYIDVPWIQDDLRDRPHQRHPMFNRFKDALDHYEQPYQVLRGKMEERLETAVKKVEELIKDK